MCKKVLNSDMEYHKVFTKTSKTSIVQYYWLHFDKYTKVYNLYGEYYLNHSDGKLLYQLKPISTIQCIMGHEVVWNRPTQNELLCLTKSNHLQRFKLDTGEYLDTIYLSSTAKFNQLHWKEMLESIFVSHLDKNKDIECIIFHIEPFYLIAKITFPKKVFGNITNVSFEQDVVMIEEKKTFSFYKLADILENNKSIQNWDHRAAIPFTGQIDRVPQVLYQIKAEQIYFGGWPHRAIAQQKAGSKIIYEIFPLENPSDVIKIPNDRNLYIVHVDKWRIMFKTDDYIDQRVIDHKTGELKSVVKIEHLASTQQKEQVTRSGRKVLNRIDDRDPIQTFDFDDETDCLAILQSGVVRIYDNEDGRLIRTFKLPGFNEEDVHQLILDRVYLVWIYKSDDNTTTVVTFRLGELFEMGLHQDTVESDQEYWLSPGNSSDEDFDQ